MTAPAAAAGMRPPVRRGTLVGHLVVVPLLLAFAAWAAKASGLDLALATLAWDTPVGDFVGNTHPLVGPLGHRAARLLPLVTGVGAFAVAAFAWRRPRLESWRLPALAVGVSMLVVTLAIAALKQFLDAHCPFQLDRFGGEASTVAAEAATLWLGAPPTPGDCLPSAHAGGGYALLALYFGGWLAGSPRARRIGLAIGIVAGVAFAAVRVGQGAHFASQTLWSATVAWTLTALVFTPWLLAADRRAGAAALA